MLCGGKINSLAASPDGLYIAVAISEKLQVWMVSVISLIVARYIELIIQTSLQVPYSTSN